MAWVALGEVRFLVNGPHGPSAPIDPDFAAAYAAEAVAKLQGLFDADPLGRALRIGWWHWSPGCIEITIGLIALVEVGSASGTLVASGMVGGAVIAVATNYKNVRDTAVYLPKDLETLWKTGVNFMRKHVPGLQRPKGVDSPPAMVSSIRYDKPMREKTRQVDQIREELVELIRNGGADVEEKLLHKMKEHHVRPKGSVLIWALHDRADEQLLAELHEVAMESQND